MKINPTNVAILLILISGLIVGAYTLGYRSDGAKEAASPAQQLPGGAAKTAIKEDGKRTRGGQAGALSGSDFTHFRVGNSNVKGIYADEDIIWIGTSRGVIRYDTSDDSYKLFDNKTPGILSNGVFHVSKLDDHIVLGTYGGGMSLYDSAAEQWRNINIPQGLADQFVYDVQKTRNGDVWIATWSGANRIRGGDLSNTSLWESFTVENTHGGLPNPWVYGVEEGNNGEMWFATEEGLARYRDDEWHNWQHDEGLGAPYETVRDTIRSTSDPAKSSMHHSRQKSAQGLEDVEVAYNPNYIISLEVDQDGIVWAGTWGAGLARFDGTTWRNFTVADGLPSNHIFMLYLDSDNQLWIGTSLGLVRRNNDGETFTVMTTADGLYANNVFSMTHGSDGSVWVGSFGGVAHINKSQRILQN